MRPFYTSPARAESSRNFPQQKLRSVNMTMPKGCRIYRVGGREYAVSIRGGKLDTLGDVPLSISIRGSLWNPVLLHSTWSHESVVLARLPGHRKDEAGCYIHNATSCMRVDCHGAFKRMDPDASKANFNLPATREDIRALIPQDDAVNDALPHERQSANMTTAAKPARAGRLRRRPSQPLAEYSLLEA